MVIASSMTLIAGFMKNEIAFYIFRAMSGIGGALLASSNIGESSFSLASLQMFDGVCARYPCGEYCSGQTAVSVNRDLYRWVPTRRDYRIHSSSAFGRGYKVRFDNSFSFTVSDLLPSPQLAVSFLPCSGLGFAFPHWRLLPRQAQKRK